jgi:S-layer homology domain
MTGQPPSPGSDRRDPLGFDEIVALLVAFAAIGAVLWWSMGRRVGNWLGQPGLLSTDPEAAQTTDPFGISGADSEVDSEAEVPAIDPAPEQLAPPVTSPASPLPAGRAQVPAVVVIPGTVVAPANRPAIAPTPAAPTPATPTTPNIVVPSALPNATVRFTDVPNDYWAYPFIADLSQRGIISGFEDGRFQPDQPVTRTEYAALISEVLPDARQNQIAFGDVPTGFWGRQAIDEAVKSGFLKGFPNSTFQPNQPISRMQVLLSLANGFQLPKPANPDLPLQAFDDRAQIPAWAKPAVAAATASNVVVNYPNVSLVNPNQPATRAEVAAMLYQALTTTGQLPPIQSNYIVRP